MLTTASFSAHLPLPFFPLAKNLRFEHHPLAHLDAAREHLLQHGIKLVERDAGQKSQAAEIDSEDRNIVAAQRSRRRKQSAIAAKNNQQVELSRQSLRARCTGTAGIEAALRFLVDENFDFPLAKPRDQRRHHGATISLIGLQTIPAARIIVCAQHFILLRVGARGEKTPDFLRRPAIRLGFTPQISSPFERRSYARLDGFFVQRGVANDPAFADFALFQLELRLDQNQKIAPGAAMRNDRRQNLA